MNGMGQSQTIKKKKLILSQICLNQVSKSIQKVFKNTMHPVRTHTIFEYKSITFFFKNKKKTFFLYFF